MNLDRREWQRLAGICLAAFAVRLLYVAGQYAIDTDGVYYAWLGEALVSGDLARGLSPYWPPLYPLLTGLAGRLAGDLELGGRLVSAFLGTLLIVPTYLLMRHAWGRRTALLGAFLQIFEPQVVRFSTKVMTDIPFAFFFVLAVLAGGLALFQRRRWAAAGAGLAFGACYLTRPEAFLFAPLLAFLMIGSGWVDPPSRKGLWGRVALLLGAFLLLISPYLLYLRAETGRFTISAKLMPHLALQGSDRKLIHGQLTLADMLRAGRRLDSVAETASPEAPAAPSSADVPDTPGSRLDTLRLQLKKVANNINRMFDDTLPQVFFAFLPVLAGLGLARRNRTREQARWEVYLGIVVCCVLAGYAVTLPVRRFLVPLMPIVLGWVAQGLIGLGDGWTAGRDKGFHRFPTWTDRLVLPALLTAVFVSLLSPITGPFRWGGDDQPYEMRLAGEWIRDQGDPEPTILADSPVVTFYAGGEHFYAPDESIDVVLDYARRRNADYLVLARYTDHGTRLKYTKRVVTAPVPPPGLELAFSTDAAPGAEVYVYRFTGR